MYSSRLSQSPPSHLSLPIFSYPLLQSLLLSFHRPTFHILRHTNSAIGVSVRALYYPYSGSSKFVPTEIQRNLSHPTALSFILPFLCSNRKYPFGPGTLSPSRISHSAIPPGFFLLFARLRNDSITHYHDSEHNHISRCLLVRYLLSIPTHLRR